jgi:hypothetical protein
MVNVNHSNLLKMGRVKWVVYYCFVAIRFYPKWLGTNYNKMFGLHLSKAYNDCVKSLFFVELLFKL